jgi:hypothetical protein
MCHALHKFRRHSPNASLPGEGGGACCFFLFAVRRPPASRSASHHGRRRRHLPKYARTKVDSRRARGCTFAISPRTPSRHPRPPPFPACPSLLCNRWRAYASAKCTAAALGPHTNYYSPVWRIEFPPSPCALSALTLGDVSAIDACLHHVVLMRIPVALVASPDFAN